ncbi:hypothetical protein, partial [Shimia sp.]|uniref:hypothetical protein n=1 Tax=Shimia sp. TaxID=1954381 RepID=UPI00356853D2
TPAEPASASAAVAGAVPAMDPAPAAPPAGLLHRLPVSAQGAMVAAIAIAAIALLGLQVLFGSGEPRATAPGDQGIDWGRYQLSENLRPEE